MLQCFLYKGKSIVYQYIAFLLAIIGIVPFVSSCNDHTNQQPNLENVAVELKSARLDKDLYQIDTNQLRPGVIAMKDKYPVFLPFYVGNLLPFVSQQPSEDTIENLLQPIGHLLTDPDFRGLFDTVAVHFPNVDEQNKQLTEGMKYMKYYYPDYKVPEVVYFISGLNNWTAITYSDTVAGKNFLGIGLDMFLGSRYPYYASVGIPAYVTQNLRPQNIPVAAFRAIYEDRNPFAAEGANLLEMMTQRGKEAFFIKAMLPEIADSLVFGFTEQQMKWCEANEAEIYNYFATNSLLFETNWQKIMRYVNEGPTTQGMPSEAPGNIGTWLGYKMVAAYAVQKGEKDLAKILSAKDGQYILQTAKYKPN